MESTQPNRQRQTGFTLVELLAVIGIIAILSSFLLPAVTRSMKSAATSACKSNQRQLMSGFESYGADNDGYWPAARAFTNTQGGQNPWSRRGALARLNTVSVKGQNGRLSLFNHMLGNQFGSNADLREAGTWPRGITGFGHIFGTVFHCPGSRYQPQGATGGWAYGYGYNGVLATRGPNTDDIKLNNRIKKMAIVDTPSTALTIVDSSAGQVIGQGAGRPVTTGGGAAYRARVRHANKVNAAFADGHVETMDPVTMPRGGDDRNADTFEIQTFWRGYKRN